MSSKRSTFSWFRVFILLGILGFLFALATLQTTETNQGEETSRRPTRVQSTVERPVQRLTPVRDDDGCIVLRNGTGEDWARLSDRDKMDLCLEAAKTLGEGDDVAWTYRVFLETFYRPSHPKTRSRRISEIVAVCQALIDNGTIKVE